MPNPLRVLHLEDSPRDAEVIRHQLEEEGVSCHVLLVDSKDRFEAALTQEPFDLIFCDYNLSGYDGISALTYAQQARRDARAWRCASGVDEPAAGRGGLARGWTRRRVAGRWRMKTLGDLEAINEKEMAMGTGIDYPGGGS